MKQHNSRSQSTTNTTAAMSYINKWTIASYRGFLRIRPTCRQIEEQTLQDYDHIIYRCKKEQQPHLRGFKTHILLEIEVSDLALLQILQHTDFRILPSIRSYYPIFRSRSNALLFPSTRAVLYYFQVCIQGLHSYRHTTEYSHTIPLQSSLTP
jgi:hypothetical protein